MQKSAKHILAKAEQLFEIRKPLINMWQSIADNFYPIRADFDNGAAQRRTILEPADWLADSYPIICHRDLANSIDSMLRDGNWFELTLGSGDEPDHVGKLWLDDSTRRMRAAMGMRESGFSRATKQGDMDYAAFGQCVITVDTDPLRGNLIYQNWHLRDVAWFDDEAGNISGVVRKWHPTRDTLMRLFGSERLDDKIVKGWRKNPFEKEEFMHVVFPATIFDSYDEPKHKYICFYIDVKNKKIVEEVPSEFQKYVIPRFFTLAESAYAYSPATMAALPDARTLQAMTFTLLEAAERYARPPMVATTNVINGVVDLRPDGITWVDNQYDERMGAGLRTLQQDKSGYPIGQHERSRVVEVMKEAFFLDKIELPQKEAEMTAYEMSERMKEYRRQVLPLFKPLEIEYNGQICETTFNIMFQRGFFGSPYDVPESLQGRDVEFKYKSPLATSEEEARMAKLSQIQQEMSMAIQIDPTVHHVVDFQEALRSSIEGINVPQEWLRDAEMVAELIDQDKQQAEVMQAAETMGAAMSGGPVQ